MRTNAAAQASPPPLPEVSRAGSRLPRITRLLALAVRFEGLLRDGTVRDYAELARLGGVSRARMTQIMSLRNLAPVIQERILGLPAVSATADVLNEHVLRGVAQRWDWREQLRMWEQLEGDLGNRRRGGGEEGGNQDRSRRPTGDTKTNTEGPSPSFVYSIAHGRTSQRQSGRILARTATR